MTDASRDIPPPGQSARGRFLRLPDVKRETGLGRTTIYRMLNAGEFPASHALSVRCVGWWSADVDAWKAARMPPQSTT